MIYTVIWEPVAVRGLRDILNTDRPGGKRLTAAVAALAADPFPEGRSAFGRSGFHRLHLGEYRALYQVLDDQKAIHVITVGRVPPR